MVYFAIVTKKPKVTTFFDKPEKASGQHDDVVPVFTF